LQEKATMQLSHNNIEVRPTTRVTPARDVTPTRLDAIEAAAEFEHRLELAQATAEAEAMAADQRAGGGGPAAEQPVDDGPHDEQGSDDSEHDRDARFSQPAWAAMCFGAGAPTPDALPVAPTSTPAPQAWAEISAHIERMLITDPAGRCDGAAALFRLAPELLRDTTVALSRNAHGWLLRIDSGDPRLRVDSMRHEAALRERFANGGLGDLVIEQGDLPDLVRAVEA
jgi:hypothetical protein